MLTCVEKSGTLVNSFSLKPIVVMTGSPSNDEGSDVNELNSACRIVNSGKLLMDAGNAPENWLRHIRSWLTLLHDVMSGSEPVN